MEITIEDELADRLSKRADRHEFESTEIYVNEILRQVLKELESPDQNEDVQNRLEDLGYL